MTSIFLIVLPLGLLLKNTYLRFFAARQNCHKGSVKDEINGDALIGCTVTVKGGKQGVTTDVNANYSISLSENNAVLVFAYIGYDSKEINVGNQSIIDINL